MRTINESDTIFDQLRHDFVLREYLVPCGLVHKYSDIQIPLKICKLNKIIIKNPSIIFDL